MQGIVNYNKIRSRLSAFVKKNDISLAKGEFNEICTKSFRENKNREVNDVLTDIPNIVEKELKTDSTPLPEFYFYNAPDQLSGINPNIDIEIFNSNFDKELSNYHGKLGDWLTYESSDNFAEINSIVQRDYYVSYVVRMSQNKKKMYMVLVHEDLVSAFDIDIFLEENEIDVKKDTPTTTVKDEIELEVQKQLTEKEKQKTARLKIEEHNAETRNIKTKSDEAMKLREAGFTPEQIMKILKL